MNGQDKDHLIKLVLRAEGCQFFGESDARCGREVRQGSSYCAEHHRRVWRREWVALGSIKSWFPYDRAVQLGREDVQLETVESDEAEMLTPA